MANTQIVFASAEYGYSDVEAGEIYGWWGFMSTLWAMVLGPVIDVLGVKRAAILGFTICEHSSSTPAHAVTKLTAAAPTAPAADGVARLIIVGVHDREIFKWTVCGPGLFPGASLLLLPSENVLVLCLGPDR